MIKLLVDNKHKLDYSLIDDVMIGKFMNTNNILPTIFDRYDFLTYEHGITLYNNKDELNKYFHFRCKEKNYKNDCNIRKHDINAMITLHNLLNR